MKQTAVEWLLNEIDMQYPEINVKRKEWMVDKAKEMEREQSIDFARLCLNKAKDLDVLTAFINVQQYYNETYGNES
jgi:hypothetical protein